MHKEIILMEKTSFKGFNQRPEKDFNVGNNCSIADRSLFKTNVYFCVSGKSPWYYMKQKHRNVISSFFVTRFSFYISVIWPWAAFSVDILYFKEKKNWKQIGMWVYRDTEVFLRGNVVKYWWRLCELLSDTTNTRGATDTNQHLLSSSHWETLFNLYFFIVTNPTTRSNSLQASFTTRRLSGTYNISESLWGRWPRFNSTSHVF